MREREREALLVTERRQPSLSLPTTINHASTGAAQLHRSDRGNKFFDTTAKARTTHGDGHADVGGACSNNNNNNNKSPRCYRRRRQQRIRSSSTTTTAAAVPPPGAPTTTATATTVPPTTIFSFGTSSFDDDGHASGKYLSARTSTQGTHTMATYHTKTT